MKIKKFLGVVLAGCMLFSVPVMAAEEQPDNVVVSDDVTITFEGTGKLQQMYENGDLDERIQDMKAEFEASDNKGTIAREPAAPVSYVGVIQVRSTQGGYEDIPRNQYTTLVDHCGAEMYVVTQKNGEGRDYANYCNMQVKSIDYASLDFNNDRIVDGWLYLWDLSGMNESGQFTYKATSYNSPWNTMSTWINIK